MPKSHRSALTAGRHRGITVSEFPPAVWDHKKLKCTCSGFSFQEPKEGKDVFQIAGDDRGPGSLLSGEGYPEGILAFSSVPRAAADKPAEVSAALTPCWDLSHCEPGKFPHWGPACKPLRVLTPYTGKLNHAKRRSCVVCFHVGLLSVSVEFSCLQGPSQHCQCSSCFFIC